MEISKPIKRNCFFKQFCGAGVAACLLGSAYPAGSAENKFRLLDHPRHKRDFNDMRSKKVIFLAHCIPNMNARMHNCVRVFPASVKPIIRFCMDNELGMAQMPCPELLVTGLGRDRDEPEVEYLRQALEQPISRERIRKLAEQVVFQMKEYRFQGFEMIGVIGNDGSPTCGVDRTAWPDANNRFAPGEGVFIQELKALMKEAGIELPFKGIDDERAEEAVAWIAGRLKETG